jgi:hypothetical protein
MGRMSEVNNFDVLKEMSKRGLFTIKMYPEDNIQDVNRGKGGWGSIKIAVDTPTAATILNGIIQDNDKMPMVFLMVVDREDFQKVKTEMESNKVTEPDQQ